MPGRLFYYRDEDGQRTYQLHVVPSDTWTPATSARCAKTELIQELTDRARADRGLPPVSVWEE